jgi:BirA family transcriptional regulator, biotin operon repressor / biotin---[acetyl-CoA-carboxylase] ligase
MDSSTSTLEAWLQKHTRFRRLLHVVSCTSTQALAQEDSPLDSSAVFWADHQTAGRGRDTRSWEDAPGLDLCVTFKIGSCVLKNPAHLAAAVPVVIVEALGQHLASLAPPQIKWPNDVLLRGRKLCGILVDTIGRDPVAHLVGIGINVNRSDFPDMLADQATSLALATGQEFDRASLLRDIAHQLEAALIDLEAGTLARLEHCFRQSLGLMDTRVRVATNNRVREGRLRRLDFETLELEDQPPIPLAHVQRLSAP